MKDDDKSVDEILEEYGVDLSLKFGEGWQDTPDSVYGGCPDLRFGEEYPSTPDINNIWLGDHSLLEKFFRDDLDEG